MKNSINKHLRLEIPDTPKQIFDFNNWLHFLATIMCMESKDILIVDQQIAQNFVHFSESLSNPHSHMQLK